MSAANASNTNTKTIYIPLLDEGTTVSRPTEGVLLRDNLYRVLATPNYNPDDENWQFKPGSIVHCVEEVRDNKKILIARTLAKT